MKQGFIRSARDESAYDLEIPTDQLGKAWTWVLEHIDA